MELFNDEVIMFIGADCGNALNAKNVPECKCFIPPHFQMYRNTYQSGFLSILYAVGAKPLEQWATHVESGFIKRITDPDIQSCVIEIMGTNIATCYITCPADPQETLAIKLPYLVMLIKNMKKYFSFEI